MEKTLVYKREGKFGKPEFLIGLDNFSVIKSKETPKAYAIGTWIDWKKSFYVDCWVAKSMCVEIEGKIFAPTWMFDKLCDMTQRINRDYYGREFEVKDFSEIKEPEKETIQLANGTAMSNIPSTDPDSDWEEEWPDAEPKKAPEKYFWKHPNEVNGVNCSFSEGGEYSKLSHFQNEKEIGEGLKLFLVSCFDKYEDGYCVFACEGNPTNDHDGKGDKFKIVSEIQFRGNCEYPSEYLNKFSGEKTFDGIKCFKDFENLKNNRYYFVEN